MAVAVEERNAPAPAPVPDGMSSEDGVMSVIPLLAASEAKRRSIRRGPGGDGSGRSRNFFF
jgi:hypothetical protein